MKALRPWTRFHSCAGSTRPTSRKGSCSTWTPLRQAWSGAPYPCHPDDVELLPGRFETLLRWVAQGYHLFFVSNQGGIA